MRNVIDILYLAILYYGYFHKSSLWGDIGNNFKNRDRSFRALQNPETKSLYAA